MLRDRQAHYTSPPPSEDVPRTVHHIRAALAAGDAVTKEERQRLREHGRRYARSRLHITAPIQERRRWEVAAAAEGSNLSAWIRGRVDEAQHGADGAVMDSLAREIHGLREDKEQLQRMQRGLLEQLDEKDQQIRTLSAQLQELLELARDRLGGA
jgi:hypothetical protein